MDRSYLLSFLFMLLISVGARSQTVRLSGHLLDEHRHEVTDAHIQEINSGQFAVSDNNGRWSIRLSPGEKIIRVTAIGFYTYLDTFRIIGDTMVELSLEHSVERIDEYVLQGHRAVEHITLPHEELSADFFNERTAENFAEALKRIPGIDAVNTGTGVSKPVIRGMSFNRVIVNNNGIKQEGQQWGADHGLEVDGMDVDRVEIVKGPSSLIYGSDGLGGVINILPPKTPEEGKLKGEFQTLAKSNNRHWGATGKLEYRKKDVFIIGRYTRHEYGDMRVPADSFRYNRYVLPLENKQLKNTAGREENASVTLGIIKDWGVSRLRFSTYNLNMGLFPGAVGVPRSYDLLPDGDDRNIDNPRQNVNHNMLTFQGDYYINSAKLSVDAGYQMNKRLERSEPHAHGNISVDHDSALFLSLNTLSGRIQLEQPVTGRLLSVSGISASYQKNNIAGFEYLIPEHTTSRTGIFQTMEYDLSRKFKLFSGIRYDHAFINTETFTGEVFDVSGNRVESPYYESLDRDFGSFSGGLGIAYEPARSFSLKFNAGKSFRFPVVAELTGNGVHHGNFRHERGNRNLNAEHGYQFDLTARRIHEKFRLSAAVYFNVFENFIYLRPASRFSNLPDGVQLWEYTRHDAVYTGYEFSADYYPRQNLRFSHRSAYVYNYNLETQLPLPYTPPLRMDHEVEYTGSLKGKHWSFTLGGLYGRVFGQNRVDRNELTTPGYNRVDLWSGIAYRRKGNKFQLRFEVQNVLNEQYFDHLSRYRLINLPEQGRNFIVRLIVPFSVFGGEKDD